MITFLNILQCLFLLLLVVACIIIVCQERRNVYGLTVRNARGKALINGMQGPELSVGRLKNSDVTLDDASVSRVESIIDYSGTDLFVPDAFITDDLPGADADSDYLCTARFDNADYTIHTPTKLRVIHLRFLPAVLTIIFLLLRYFSLMQDFPSGVLLFAPIGMLILYNVLSALLCTNGKFSLNANGSTVIESAFSVLLSYYIYASLYKTNISDSDVFSADLKKCALGVAMYVVLALAARILVTLVDFSYFPKIRAKHLKKARSVLGERFNVLDVLRGLCIIGIFVLMVLNIILGKLTYGAFNWIEIAGIRFQPSEFIKPLFIILLLIPNSRHFEDLRNLIYIIAVPAAVFMYAILIRDIGFLVEVAAVWLVQFLLNNRNYAVTFLVAAGMFFAERFIMHFSANAASRVTTWKQGSVLEALASKGAFVDPFDKGYQETRALIASFANGGAFGRKYIDIDLLRYVGASDSDLVGSIICQRYGVLSFFLVLALVTLTFIAAIVGMRKKTKVQQSFTALYVVIMVIAFVLNIGGTFGIIPLTGIVAPALSKGLSASVSYGIGFGVLCAVSPNIQSIFAATPQEVSAIALTPANLRAFPQWAKEFPATVKALAAQKMSAFKNWFNGKSWKSPRTVFAGTGILALVLAVVMLVTSLSSVGKIFSNLDRKEKAQHYTAAEQLTSDRNVVNILLLGVDARSDDNDESSRADTMLMVTIDKVHGCIKMTSFLRDSWVYIPAKKGEQRLNAASAYGGYPGVVDAIEYNFGVAVDGYAVVDFETFKILVDSLGGVQMKVTKEEANEINNHPGRYGKVKIKAGDHLLTGKQALAFARIRKIDTDFKRTERQRKVLTAILNAAKANPLKFIKGLKEAAHCITTDLTDMEMVSAGWKAVKCVGKVYQKRVPFGKNDDGWKYATKGGASVIDVDTKYSKKRLIHYLYEETPEELEKQ